MSDLPHKHTRIIRRKALIAMLGISAATFADMQNPKSPRFNPAMPPKIMLGARAVGYDLEAIERWIESRTVKSKKAQ